MLRIMVESLTGIV